MKKIIKKQVADLSAALSQSSCEKDYAELMMYLKVLLDYKVISDDEYESLCHDANLKRNSYKKLP